MEGANIVTDGPVSLESLQGELDAARSNNNSRAVDAISETMAWKSITDNMGPKKGPTRAPMDAKYRQELLDRLAESMSQDFKNGDLTAKNLDAKHLKKPLAAIDTAASNGRRPAQQEEAPTLPEKAAEIIDTMHGGQYE